MANSEENGLPATSAVSKPNSASAGRLIERIVPSGAISTTPSVAVSTIARISAMRASRSGSADAASPAAG